MLRIWIIGLLGSLFAGVNAFTRQEWEKYLIEATRLKENTEVPNYDEKVLKIYTETIKLLPAGHPAIIGKNEIREYFQRTKNSERQRYTNEVTAEKVIAASPQFAIVWHNFVMRMEGRNTRQGKSIVVLRDVQGEVKVEVDIWNFDE